MRLYKILCLSTLLLTFFGACSDDDAPDIPLEDIRLSFNDSMLWIHAMPPAAMRAVKDPAVQRTMEYLTRTNLDISIAKNEYFQYDESQVQVVDTAVMEAKPGVRYRTSLILNPDFGMAFGHQMSVQRDRYVFESFSMVGHDPVRWKRGAYAEELTSQMSGMMEIYGSVYSSDPTREYAWQREGDNFFLNAWKFGSEQQNIRVTINQRTQAGFLLVYEYSLPVFESHWTEAGAGTWAERDEQGNISSSGTWEPAQ
jgi:Ni/Co efflux regulator RcnB